MYAFIYILSGQTVLDNYYINPITDSKQRIEWFIENTHSQFSFESEFFCIFEDHIIFLNTWILFIPFKESSVCTKFFFSNEN